MMHVMDARFMTLHRLLSDIVIRDIENEATESEDTKTSASHVETNSARPNISFTTLEIEIDTP